MIMTSMRANRSLVEIFFMITMMKQIITNLLEVIAYLILNRFELLLRNGLKEGENYKLMFYPQSSLVIKFPI
jgi:hypothetical protein